ncbi:MAG: S-methyl-5-thioribose-1-phosphate isomerase, partial [Bacteroidetes bacterium]
MQRPMTGNEERKRTIWVADSHPQTVSIIDQRFLPHELRVARLRTVEEVCRAIKEMWVRGAPLIGATAAYGMYLACLEAENSAFPLNLLNVYAAQLKKTRPTA